MTAGLRLKPRQDLFRMCVDGRAILGGSIGETVSGCALIKIL